MSAPLLEIDHLITRLITDAGVVTGRGRPVSVH